MEVLHKGGYFYEGARWHGGNWYVSDIWGKEILRVSPSGESERIISVADSADALGPSGLGWLPDGSLIFVSMEDRRIKRIDPQGQLSIHSDLSHFTTAFINDMIVRADGTAFVSCNGFDITHGAPYQQASIYRVAPDGTPHIAASELHYPNGMAFAGGDRTLIVGELMGNRIAAFDLADDGLLSNRRVWAEFGPIPPHGTIAEMMSGDYGPDGMTVDAEGCIWVADAWHARVCRVAPGGAILQEIAIPDGLSAFSCALGGLNDHTLLICAAPHLGDVTETVPRAAVLYTTQVTVPAPNR